MIPKFRAWAFKKEMLDVALLNFTHQIAIIFKENKCWEVKLNAIILMQSTGVKDKNDNEIYDSDIVKFRWYSNQENKFIWLTGKVVWFNYSWMINCESNKTIPCNSFINISGFGSESLEKIGNIYENPELLKEMK